MDRGEFIRTGYEVSVGMNGSFVLMRGFVDGFNVREMIGFTNWKDLTDFLYDEHQALAERDVGKTSNDEGFGG